MPDLHIQYCEDVKIVWDEICNVHEAKKLKTSSSLTKVSHHQDVETIGSEERLHIQST
jgi:hypothetical protein